MIIISVKSLKKQFKKVQKRGILKDMLRPKYIKTFAVDDISFEINKGEAVAFLGPNGAGKTTTIKMLTGLIYPTEGEVSVLGFKPQARKKEFLRRIGLVMGNKAGLNWDLTPRQSFELLRQIYRIPQKEYLKRITELTTLLDSENFLDTQVRRLSLGERMKMELIGAILHSPEVLFLDEPTIGLDIISKQKIRTFLKEIQKNFGVTLLLTSHDMDDVETVCDRVIVINHGKKIYDDSINNLTSKYKKERFIKFTFKASTSLAKLKNLKSLQITNLDDLSCTICIEKEKMPELIANITKEFEVDDIDILSVPLEEMITDIFNS